MGVPDRGTGSYPYLPLPEWVRCGEVPPLSYTERVPEVTA